MVFNRDYYLSFMVMILILHFPLIITHLVLFKGEEAFMAESQTFYLLRLPLWGSSKTELMVKFMFSVLLQLVTALLGN